jgi:dTDP-4-dehydrorhamnose 3,5-epimerase-like enzyme
MKFIQAEIPEVIIVKSAIYDTDRGFFDAVFTIAWPIHELPVLSAEDSNGTRLKDAGVYL